MQLLQKNLELCSTILHIELHCSTILKQKLLFYYLSLSSVSLTLPLSQTLSPTSLSLRLLPLPLLSTPSPGRRWPLSPLSHPAWFDHGDRGLIVEIVANRGSGGGIIPWVRGDWV